jgi:hypothetical protein
VAAADGENLGAPAREFAQLVRLGEALVLGV